MFEEDFERCFICQAPCKGLYCSAECRLQDKGAASPAPKATATPVYLTAQLPAALSPLIRPIAHIAPSPRMPPHMISGDSSSNSSITSSPLHSPATNPAGADSPQKEPFDLPPPAYPHSNTYTHAHQHMAAFGSVPVKIPALVPRPSAAPHGTPTLGHGTPLHGTSIDTLRFGRKSGVINSVTSPNALQPRCACGKPANHRSRNASKERPSDSEFARLTLGPSVLQAPHPAPRVLSDGAQRKAASGCSTPHDYSLGASLLSRSRSDPIPPNLQTRHSAIRPGYEQDLPSPSRRASAAAAERSSSSEHQTHERARAMKRSGSNGASAVGNGSASAGGGGNIEVRRGRSRSRHRHPVDIEPSTGLLNHPPEREAAPSRSRHRRDEREREVARERQRARAVSDLELGQAQAQAHGQSLHTVQPTPITPSWSRLADAGQGVAPSLRRSPKGCAEQQRERAERERELEQARAL